MKGRPDADSIARVTETASEKKRARVRTRPRANPSMVAAKSIMADAESAGWM